MSKQFMKMTVKPGETVVDATAGNGNDTLFLAQLVEEKGHVIAFDIQQSALDATKNRLGKLHERVTLILDSHEHVSSYIQEPIAGAMFNLGYLPHGDDLSIVTKPHSTIRAIHELLHLLKCGGMIVIAVYDGHDGGKEERDALMQYVQTLSQRDVNVAKYAMLNLLNNPPFLIAIEKIREFEKLEQIES